MNFRLIEYEDALLFYSQAGLIPKSPARRFTEEF
jgi:hypothetical protein